MSKEIVSGIYKITNIKNKKAYIGSSKDVHKRFKNHLNMLKKGKHHSKKLQRSWNLTKDKSIFQFEVIELVEDISKLLDIEQTYIDRYDSYKSGYNTIPFTKPELLNKGNLHNKITKRQKVKMIADECDKYYKEIMILLDDLNQYQEENILTNYQIRKLSEPLKNTPMKHKKNYLFLKWYSTSEYAKSLDYKLSIDNYKSVNPWFKIYKCVDGVPKELTFMEIDKKYNIIDVEKHFGDGTYRSHCNIFIANTKQWLLD